MQAVPVAFYLFLVEFAAGGLLISALLDWDGEVSPGFLFLNSVFAALFGAFGIWLRLTLPAERLAPYAAGRPALDLEAPLWVAFLAAGIAQTLLYRVDRRPWSRALGAGAGLLGVAALATSGAAYAPPGAHLLPAAMTLVLGSLALGTAWSAMMLGHWYLVTPLLATRPLLRLTAGLGVVLLLQGALFAWAVTQLPVDPSLGWLYWLRAGVGIAFPLALVMPVWRTARVRSMMSATGLLYVALGVVLAGEIMATVLLLLAGTPV